jgi:hypothetical protein
MGGATNGGNEYHRLVRKKELIILFIKFWIRKECGAMVPSMTLFSPMGGKLGLQQGTTKNNIMQRKGHLLALPLL